MRVAAAADGGQHWPVSSGTSPVQPGATARRGQRDTPRGRGQAEATLPPGVRRACSQVGWLADVADTEAFALLRADAQDHVLAVAHVVALHADWQTYTSRPTWPVLTERTGLSRRTVARHLAWLREHQLLVWVERGTTAELSPGVLQCGPDGERPGNIATVYLLVAPVRVRLVAVAHPEDYDVEHIHAGPVDAVEAAAWRAQDHPAPEVSHELSQPGSVDTSDTPTPSVGGKEPPTRARLSPSGAGLRPALTTPPPMRRVPNSKAPDAPRWALTATPAGKKERRAAAMIMQEALPVLQRISAEHLAHLCREYFLAGWTPRDVLTALGRRPDGTAWSHEDAVRHVPGWFRYRLAPWRADPGDPVSPVATSPSRRAEAEAARRRALDRAVVAASRTAAAAAQAAAVDPGAVPALLAARARQRARARALRIARRHT